MLQPHPPRPAHLMGDGDVRRSGMTPVQRVTLLTEARA